MTRSVHAACLLALVLGLCAVARAETTEVRASRCRDVSTRCVEELIPNIKFDDIMNLASAPHFFEMTNFDQCKSVEYHMDVYTGNPILVANVPQTPPTLAESSNAWVRNAPEGVDEFFTITPADPDFETGRWTVAVYCQQDRGCTSASFGMTANTTLFAPPSLTANAQSLAGGEHNEHVVCSPGCGDVTVDLSVTSGSTPDIVLSRRRIAPASLATDRAFRLTPGSKTIISAVEESPMFLYVACTGACNATTYDLSLSLDTEPCPALAPPTGQDNNSDGQNPAAALTETSIIAISASAAVIISATMCYFASRVSPQEETAAGAAATTSGSPRDLRTSSSSKSGLPTNRSPEPEAAPPLPPVDEV